MIQVTCLDNSKMTVNVELIQSFRETPDTVITFVSKNKIVVREPVEEIYKRILEYQRLIHRDSLHILSPGTQSLQRMTA